jgi:ATP phosphoribosyltransferase regulatory subunit
LTDHGRAALMALRAVDCPLADAPRAVASLAEFYGLAGMDDALAAFRSRVKAILALVPIARHTAQFRAGFGRRFTYYDGFVFEVLADGLAETQPVAAGGRYDGLISGLSSGRVSSTGIGGVVRPDRMVRVRRAEA